MSFEDLAIELGEQVGREVTLAEVKAAYERVSQQIVAIERKSGTAKPLGLWFRAPLMPRAAAAILARMLGYAFRPAGFVVVGALTAFAIWRNFHTFLHPPAELVDPAGLFWATFGLLALAMAVHELGHISACAYYGIKAGTIGFGLYWIFPVFYSDVSAAWALTRRQRIVVDLGGFYFHLIVGAVYLEIYRATGYQPARFAFTGIVFAIFFMLNPMFKFDGYWFLADALGVPNLSRQFRRVVVHAAGRVRRRAVVRLPWSRWTITGITVYGLLATGLLTSYVIRLTPAVARVAASYPDRMAGLWRDLYFPPHELATGRLQSVFFPTYLLAGVCLAMVTIVVKSAQAIGRYRAPRGAESART